jgi:2-polyprenyl-6-methoxyphenol hydroxylase-like FAD-dependent oxidoreductase
MTSNRIETQVAIVGAGPVGLGLAIELGQRGINCVVIERYLQPQPIPKGQNLTQRTMEHVRAWGAEAELRAARTIPKEYGIGGMTAYGTLLGDHRYDWLQRELVRPFYATDNERLPQYATEAVLRARAAEFPHVTLLFGWSAEEVAQDEAGATVAISERSSGRRASVHASYVVGCDGSRSTIREAAGIAETRTDHDRLMVLLVFRSTALHDLLERYPGKSFYNVLHPDLEGYWLFLGRVDLGDSFFFHAPVPLGTTAGNFDFRTYLRTAAGADFDMEFDHVGFWELRIAIADHYREGRVFIAGDAAHSHPPYGGYGVNTGLEDARNLGWKLAAALQGWGGEALLGSYEAERRPVFASTARDFIEKAIADDRDFLRDFAPDRDLAAFEQRWAERGSGARDEVGAFEPHYEGSPFVFGPKGGVCSAVGRHAFEARAGHHLSPQPLSDGRNVFEALGADFTLLAFDADGAPFAAAAARLGVPLTVVEDSGDGGRKAYGAALVLVRPDHFVAWAGEAEGADPAVILARATGLQSNG